MDLKTKVQFLKGVGPKMGVKLNKLGIETVNDLLHFYPRRYEDYTQITKISDLARYNNQDTITRQISNSRFQIESSPSAQNDNTAIYQYNNFTIRARIVGIANKRTSKRRFTITEAVVEDGTGSLKVVWFNQPYLEKMLRAGSEVILNGKVDYNFYSHDLVMESPNRANKPKIVPIYAETAGISSYFISKLTTSLISHLSFLEEYLPGEIIEKNKLLGIKEAIENIHMPKDSEMLERARERIAFDELFIISLRAQLSKIEVEQKIAPQIEIDGKLLKDFTSKLPFELTEDQKKAAWVIIKDMAGDSPSVIASHPPGAEAKQSIGEIAASRTPRNDGAIEPMNRLLNGDVGSGKTVVAAFAAYVAIKAGYRVALMAPTEILAQQHFKTCCDILAKFDISVGLITSSIKKITGRHCEEPPAGGDEAISKYRLPRPKGLAMTDRNDPSLADLVIGTHALLQDKIDLQNIGLVIVDEQHRFGVRQRAALLKSEILNPKSETNPNLQNSKSEKAKSPKGAPSGLKPNLLTPHFLSMTATPIPRTLYLALFADLDLSVVKTMPVGRKEIKTRVVDEANRNKAYQFIHKQIEAGRQAFVICPLIEDKITNHKSQITNKLQSSNSKPSSHSEQNEGSQSDSSVENSFRMTEQQLFDVERKSVVAEFEKLNEQIFPDLKIGMLHGRMKSKEKEAVMSDFSAKGETSPRGGKAKKIDILVSTSVVEVGVDIPNASIMMIEDAERFGLAQLHQFRGRVGRAEHQSFCFLFSATQNPLALSRLQAMEQTNDGFKLAELDLGNRGAGDIFGVMQSGDINLKMASLSDRVMIEKASSAAREIVTDIKKYPALMEKVKEFESGRHLE